MTATVAIGGLFELGYTCDVVAFSFHPIRSEVCMATAGAQGYELVEADIATGQVFARTPLRRCVRHLCHQLIGTNSCLLLLAYDAGDIEVWDGVTRVLKDRMLPSKKDEGKAVTAIASNLSRTGVVIYYVRGGSAIERAEVGTSKSLRYCRSHVARRLNDTHHALVDSRTSVPFNVPMACGVHGVQRLLTRVTHRQGGPKSWPNQ